jgi:hypothetical protein
MFNGLSAVSGLVVAALARHSVHESEWRPWRPGSADAYQFAIFYVLCTVRSRISVHQRTISYHHTMVRLPSCLEAAVCNSQRDEAHTIHVQK